jgi:DNA-binding CsgD family transcriptional regulator
MARRREGTVHESAAELEALERRLDGTAAARIRLLRAIKQHPDKTMDELATELEYSTRNMHRWWADYRRNGLGSIPGAQTRSRGSSGPRRSSSIDDDPPAAHRQQDVSTRMARFLNGLPTSFDADEWMQQFHANLKMLLDGVDVISLRINLASRVEHPDEECAEFVVVDRMQAHEGFRSKARSVRTARMTTTPGRILVQQIIEDGLAASMYQLPHVFDYYLGGVEYVGSIVLWRQRSKKPVPAATLELLATLQQFIAFAMSDCVSRHIKRDPSLRYFRQIIDNIASRIGLTGREAEIFVLQLTGASRQEIAHDQGIALSTVGKYIARIHEKAGTRNYTELLTRYTASDE